MASAPAGTKVEKLSFAKVVAAGLKSPGAQQSSIRADTTRKHDVTSPAPDADKVVSPSSDSNQAVFTPKQKKIVALAPISTEELDSVDIKSPAVHVQTVQSASPPIKTPRALDGMLMPANADDAGTQTSSSDSVKPPSLDGKSVTSGTTFALDEKESLRPDDSASVKARDDEDSLPAPEVSLPEAQTGDDEQMRAFRDQLREISVMEPGRQHIHPQSFSHSVQAAPGVLYVPLTGPGVGNVPGMTRDTSGIDQAIEFPPDPKLLEALESPKDRIMVLKLEQDIVDFVKDAKEHSLKLPQTNTFYRMLAHKLADYYKLGHVVDEANVSVCIYKTPNCRLPPPLTGIATPSTAASTPPPVGPQMKILRRGVDNAGPTIANGSNVTSKTTSENGESGNEDDKKGKVATREEREARYEAARKRILGSAKPSDSPEEMVEVDNSRSSSAAGRKNNRKKRADSDDDFEARSAYSAYYAVPQTTSGAPLASHYGYANGAHAQNTQFSQASYPSQAMTVSYQQFNGQPAGPWMNQSGYHQQAPANWMPQQQPAYDMSVDFQRAMSFQSSPMTAQYPTMQAGYGVNYNPQMAAPQQQPWPQQSPYMTSYPQQPAQPFVPNYPARTPPMPTQTPDAQPYQYGQLPSQAFPGRPPSKLEHPLPGSYKSKHFNPQSQSFIPTHMNGPNTMPFQPHSAPMTSPAYGSGYGVPTTPQRQPSTPSQTAMYAQPQPAAPTNVASARAPVQPMTHPLPQPVFPQQPSPTVPLPPKPEATPPKPTDKNANGPAIVSSVPSGFSQGSIRNWATPASLPAKPPPATGGIPMTGHIAQSSRS